MHCGGKKNQPCPASIISRVFQLSWFPKPKPKCTKTQPVLREANFYSSDDAYWRLSFSTGDRKSITAIPVPSFKSKKSEENQYKNLAIDDHFSRKKQLGRAAEDDGNRMLPFDPVMEKYIFPIKKSVYNSRDFSLVRSVDESERRLSKSDKLHFQRRIKPKCNSPKREFRVRALEGMKKERTKSKKKATKEPVDDGATVFDSFAEMKTSFDPRKDFRDSMVEMIRGKGIRRREELEDLLACYLTLNHDKYHGLIIRVFKQVCLELKTSLICS